MDFTLNSTQCLLSFYQQVVSVVDILLIMGLLCWLSLLLSQTATVLPILFKHWH